VTEFYVMRQIVYEYAINVCIRVLSHYSHI